MAPSTKKGLIVAVAVDVPICPFVICYAEIGLFVPPSYAQTATSSSSMFTL